MPNAITTALSGALAAQTRMAGSASNVANMRSTGALPGKDGIIPAGAPQPYQAVRTVQHSVAGPDGQGMGTRAYTRPANPAVVAELSPDSPFANEDGMIAAPNVDPAGERVEQIAAGAAYKAALSVIKTQDEMERELGRLA